MRRVPGVLAACGAAAALLAGCGGAERQDADEASGTYELEIVSATFPARQSVARRETMRIAVRNAGESTLPRVAVTVETQPAKPGEAAMSFAQRVADSQLADPSRPVWIVDSEPSDGAVAHTNTWALGRLARGRTATFEWRVTPVEPGTYTIRYSVFPGLDGKARPAGARRTQGRFRVRITDAPPAARVGDDGNVVRETQ